MRRNHGKHSKKAQHLPKRAEQNRFLFTQPGLRFTSLLACVTMVMAVATWGVFELWNPLDSASQSLSSAASGTNTDSTANTAEEST